MIRYSVPINLHRYRDTSDRPTSATMRFAAESREDLHEQVYKWRSRVWETEEPILRGRTPWFVGMVFPEAAEVLQ